MEIKPCRKCGASDRYANGACKACGKAAQIKCKENKSKNIKKAPLSEDEKREIKRLRQFKWRLLNKDHIQAYNKKYAEATPYKPRNRGKSGKPRTRLLSDEKKLRDCARAKAWYEKNKSKILSRLSIQYKENPSKTAARVTAWKAKNPERRTVWGQNRSAKLKKAEGKLSSGIVKKLLSLQRNKCACCGKSLDGGYHLDHIMPIALGGGNVDSNIQLLTPTCNLQKHAKHPIDFMQQRGLLL